MCSSDLSEHKARVAERNSRGLYRDTDKSDLGACVDFEETLHLLDEYNYLGIGVRFIKWMSKFPSRIQFLQRKCICIITHMD